MLYVNQYYPHIDRKSSHVQRPDFDFCIPENGNAYVCKKYGDVQNHDFCRACQVSVEDVIICYVNTDEPMTTEYHAYMPGIPVGHRLRDKRGISEVVGSILCPFCTDTHKSAYRFSNGSVYCFHKKKWYPAGSDKKHRIN